DQDCLSGWSFYEGHCYQLFRLKTWDEAEKYCNQWDGGHLVSIESNAKAEFVAQLISRKLPKSAIEDRVWIGLRDRSKREQCGHLWTDNSFVHYEHVVPPTKCFVLERQTEFRKWIAVNCEFKFPFVCKAKIPR
uniref:Snaclec echicetin subunit alpha n=1 Tax=Echis carinatus sochureki TaxID=124223 RepID=SLA_ECHCS|nr:RecName: Full=Snaclec echicetin subunit alpha [Echis carinatus sochureki]